MKRRGLTVVAVLMIVIGGIWFLQGIDVLGTSGEGMTGNANWSYIGAIVVLVGAGLIVWARRRGKV